MLKLKKIDAENYPEFPEKNARMLPTLYLDSKQVPEISGWEVGEVYTVVLQIKQTSKSENDTEKDGKVNSVRAEFDIVAYKAMDDYENMTDKELEDLQGEVQSKS